MIIITDMEAHEFEPDRSDQLELLLEDDPSICAECDRPNAPLCEFDDICGD